MKMDKVQQIVKKVNRKMLTNNTQKVLMTLLNTDGWVARESFKIPFASSRIRDLRTEKFGGFTVECKSAAQLKKQSKTSTTFYRVVPTSVTVSRLRTVFGEAITS